MNNLTDKDIQNKEEELTLNIGDILRLIGTKWYWFVISGSVCLALATLYLMWAPKMYERTATVLIKDDNSKSAETALFQDLSVFEGKSNVNNEMIIFKSNHIMAEAVNRLNLDVSYTVRNGLRTVELYSGTPVLFSFVNMEDAQNISFKAKLAPDNEIELWDLEINGVRNDTPVRTHLNDTLTTSVGNIVPTPSLWYSDAWFGKTISITKSDKRNVISYFVHALKVALADKQTSVVNLSIEDVSIQRAEDIINTVIAIYNEEAINDKNIMAVNTENFINERLIIIEQELGNVDAKIMKYKTQHQLTDIQSDAQLALQESSSYDQEVARLQNQRKMAEYVRNYLSDPRNSSDLIPSNTGVNDINVESQINNYNQELLKRNKLIDNSSERNPVVQDLNKKLTSLRQSIIRTVDNLIVNLDIQLRSVTARNQRTKARISAVPQQETEVTSIGREQTIMSQLYLNLLDKREENAIYKAITVSTARIVDPANGRSTPVAPRSMIVILAALVIGIALPGMIIYILMVSDITVRNRKDLTSALTIPFLGEVPYRKARGGGGKKGANYVAVRANGRDPVSEAFRIIRTNLDFMRAGQERIQVITVTSLFVGSGKTFLSYNLAVSLAMTGKRVALVDMDVRKGTLSKHVSNAHDNEHVGLTNYLSGMTDDLEAMLQNNPAFPDVDVISSGPEPPNPAELLLSPRLDELFATLRIIYDYIVIDNVPSGMVADAVITNRVADVTLYIIRAGKMDRRLLPEIEQLYIDKKLKNMALVLNAVGSGKSNGFGYGYGYGYG